MRRRGTEIFAIIWAALAAIWAALAAAVSADCHGPPFPMSRSPGNGACSDPCAAMVCPSGDHCVWDTNCQPRCEAQPLPTFSR